MVSGHLESAVGERAAVLFEAAYVVALPAMDGERDGGQGLEGRLGVHAQSGVDFLGLLVAFSMASAVMDSSR